MPANVKLDDPLETIGGEGHGVRNSSQRGEFYLERETKLSTGVGGLKTAAVGAEEQGVYGRCGDCASGRGRRGLRSGLWTVP